MAVRESKKTIITTGMAAKGTKYMPLPTYSNIRIEKMAKRVMKEIRNTMFLIELRKRGRHIQRKV